MRKSLKGFTLIELMITIAIVGILAAIAIPAYQNYVVRAEVTEGMSIADGYKANIIEFYAANGAFPALAQISSGTAIAAVGKFETSVTVTTGGVIEITYGGQAANPGIQNAILDLVPYITQNDDIIWLCGYQLEPASATKTPGAVNSTNIKVQYLPSSCHS